MRCTVCHHPQRQEIDRGLAAGVSVKVLALRHGLSRSALARHQRNHVRNTDGTRSGYRSGPGAASRRLMMTRLGPNLPGPREKDRRPGSLTPLGQVIEETQELLEQLKIWWEALGHRYFSAGSGEMRAGTRSETPRGRVPGDADPLEQERLAVGL